MIKKSISKLKKIFNKNLIQKSKVILLGITIASLFLPILPSVPSVQAADCNNLSVGATDKVDFTGLLSPFKSWSLRISKNTVALDENFKIYMDVKLTSAVGEACKAQADKNYVFVPYFYGTEKFNPASPVVLKSSSDIKALHNINSYTAEFYGDATSGYGFRSLIETSVSKFDPRTNIQYYQLYSYFTKNENKEGYYYDYKNLVIDNTKSEHPETDSTIPNIELSKTNNLNNRGSGVLYDAIKFRVALGGGGLNATNYRHFYRVTFADGGWVAATLDSATEGISGSAGVSSTMDTVPEIALSKLLLLNPLAINKIYAQSSTSTPATYNTKLVSLSGYKIPVNMSIEETDGVSWTKDAPTNINYSSIGQSFGSFGGNYPLKNLSIVAVEDKQGQDKNVCGALKFNPQQIACDETKIGIYQASGGITSLAKDPKPFPLTDLNKTNLSKLGVKDVDSSGKPVLSKVVLYPTLSIQTTLTNLLITGPGNALSNLYGFSYNKDVQNVFIEVYKNKAELEAHKNDPPPPGVSEYVDAVTSSSTSSDKTDLGSALFNFIRKVIAYIVLLITSFVYWIFATILVPVLVALIRVHPYKDEFVNFIYPGWIIIRNISNIVFIVALLYMGMKILFQQEDASKTRGFIITLVLMALLVNFSLVIGQGIVAIADTVQSQFLPENSKVIETLGHKLMVDPIIVFRGGDSNLTSGGNFTADTAASDIPKAIVLLVLSLAAFFSFIALIAFMFVRLVALWLLYMMSPLAYVGRILPETKKYASDWWTQFFTYAFNVPILAFFLNIAALIAVTFSAQTGDQVQIQGARGYLLGDSAAGLAEFALTVVSHFIVLLFIYIGMQYASRFGGYGAKQIVGFASKGFNMLTKDPIMALGRGAKDLSKSVAKTQYERRIQGGMLDPKAWTKAFKDRVSTQTENIRGNRLNRKANKLNPTNILPSEGSLWKRAGHIGKYLGYKAILQDPHKMLNVAEGLKDKAEILTDLERSDLNNDQTENRAKVASIKQEQVLLPRNEITEDRANEISEAADKRFNNSHKSVLDLEAKRRALAKKLEQKDGISPAEFDNVPEYTDLIEQLTAARGDEANASGIKAIIDFAKANPNANGNIEFNADSLDEIKVVFDPKNLAVELEEDLKKLDKKIEGNEDKIKVDDERRAKYGVSTMTESDRESIRKEAIDISKKAAERYMPTSHAAIEARRSLQSSQAKKLEYMDDVDELVEAYSGAMKHNNTPFATEIAKKLAKIGGLDELLKSQGRNNNQREFQQFIDQDFGKLAPQVRLQIASEISTIAKANGNLTIGNSNDYSYNKGTGETVIHWASPQKSQRKLDAKLKNMGGDELKKLQKTDISEEKAGAFYLHKGFIDSLNGMSATALNGFKKNLSTSIKEHIQKSRNRHEFSNLVKSELKIK